MFFVVFFLFCFFFSLKLNGMNVTTIDEEKLRLQMFQSISIKLAITGVLTKLLLHQK